jgi:ADP-heptose:LPS heptosyltransferase
MRVERIRQLDRWLGVPALVCLNPLVFIAGRLLRRDHQPSPMGRVCFLKLLGGGSLILAYPALLGIRKRFPNHRLMLVTTRAVEPFARTLAVFDEILVIETGTFVRLAVTGLRALLKCLRVDTVVDLEVYSKLSSVFAVLTLARNRIGFVRWEVFWRRAIYTHLAYFNQRAAAHNFYEALAGILGASPASITECRERLLSQLDWPKRTPAPRRIGLGCGCSDLSPERALTAGQWLVLFRQWLRPEDTAEIRFLGVMADAPLAERIAAAAAPYFPRVTFQNHCGRWPLAESLRALAGCDEYWGIDSALLHYARLIGLRCRSLWGPTDPRTLLYPIPGAEEEVHWAGIPCSPCVHVTARPPCGGNNVCMQRLVDASVPTPVPVWSGPAPLGPRD